MVRRRFSASVPIDSSNGYIKAFLKFWYDFIAGDDWTIAASIAVAIAVTFWLAKANIQAWWLLPVVVILTLGISLWRATRAE